MAAFEMQEEKGSCQLKGTGNSSVWKCLTTFNGLVSTRFALLEHVLQENPLLIVISSVVPLNYDAQQTLLQSEG